MRHTPLSELVGRSVVTAEDGTHLGTVAGALIAPEDGRLLALRVRAGFLFVRRWVVTPTELRAWDRDVIVPDVDALAREEDISRLADAYPWVGLPVRSLEGRRLGAVYDLRFDPLLHAVEQLIVRSVLVGLLTGAVRMLPISAVLEVHRDGIVVNDRAVRRGRALLRALRPKGRQAPAPVAPVG